MRTRHTSTVLASLLSLVVLLFTASASATLTSTAWRDTVANTAYAPQLEFKDTKSTPILLRRSIPDLHHPDTHLSLRTDTLPRRLELVDVNDTYPTSNDPALIVLTPRPWPEAVPRRADNSRESAPQSEDRTGNMLDASQ